MQHFDPAAYGPVFAQLLRTDRNRSLAEGEPSEPPVAVTLESAFAHTAVADRQRADCCLAGVWLLYDQLDRSHRLSQSIHTPWGSYWHGVMHRREGDYSNAKYWFRQSGDLPFFAALAEDVAEISAGSSTGPSTDVDRWDPSAFVDRCASAVRESVGEAQCRALQQAEWERLFDACYRAATGG